MDKEAAKTKKAVSSYEVWTVPPIKYVMKNHCSYHGVITGAEAMEILLKNKEQSCYLTRYSKTKKSYILTVRSPQIEQEDAVHLKMKIDNKKSIYELESSKKEFPSIDELLSYYEVNPLSETIRSIGKPCLTPELQQQKQEEEEQEKQQLQQLQQLQQQKQQMQKLIEQQNQTQRQMDEMYQSMRNEIAEQREQIAKQQKDLAEQQEKINKQAAENENIKKKMAAPRETERESSCAIL